jgi:nucleoside phosphorylase/GTPase SAR1 family protein
MVDESSRSGSSGVSAVIYSAYAVPAWPARTKAVRKIVLGKPPAEKSPLAISELPDDFAARYPELTHLYLWQLEGLQCLPDLPPKLKCLDIRGCAQLSELPALPATLDTLDLGGCTGLKSLPDSVLPALERFYFDGCSSLLDFSLYGFLHRLEESHVYEIDGSECPAVTSLQQLPAETLRKLVLEGCTRLTDISRIGYFKALEHLNLGNCTGIRVLPALPPKLRFLVLDGAENLNLFMAQDIGPYDRGKNGQNVARAFVSRKKFGKDLGVMPHAKLLLLGNGRVGKTTLAKRLQWEEAKPHGKPNLKPSPDEPFNHKIHFWKWDTGLILPDAEKTALEERAEAASIRLPRTSDGLLAGGIRIWDFGGQEIYHGTHRIFAGEGSVFLLVWSHEPPELHGGPASASELWPKLNRQRPLDYWLDYIYSLRPDAQVALVCTKCPNPDSMSMKPDWRQASPKYSHRELPEFFVNSLDDLCGQHVQYQRLVRWIREACGREAARIGILQPRFYSEIGSLVGKWQQENSDAREASRLPKNLLYPWEDWTKTVTAEHHPPAGGAQVEERDVDIITDYLHQAGHLFRIRHGSMHTVLVDQSWAAELIYRLLAWDGPLCTIIRGNGGWFWREHLEPDELWQGIKDDGRRERLLSYMQDCRIITRISPDRRGSGGDSSGRDLFLASNKWLLPEYRDRIQEIAEEQLQKVRNQTGFVEVDKFEFENVTLSEFDFRNLQAQMAGVYGTGGLYFSNGFQVLDENVPPRWCFRLRWIPISEDSFDGTIDAVLVAHRSIVSAVGQQIEDFCYAEGGPLAKRPRKVLRKRAAEDDLGRFFYLPGGLSARPEALRPESAKPATRAEPGRQEPAMKLSADERADPRDLLDRLLDAQFERLLRDLNVPLQHIKPDTAARSLRVNDLLQWADQEPSRRSRIWEWLRTGGVSEPTQSTSPQSAPAASTGPTTPSQVDVVILTALTLEFEAVRKVSHGLTPEGAWREETSSTTGLPIAFATFGRQGKPALRVALAHAGGMGVLSAGVRLYGLVEKFKPHCVAMTGVCAGRPGKTNLGDVIAAERLFLHDSGKLLASGVQADIKTYNLPAAWRVRLEKFAPLMRFADRDWFRNRPLPLEWQENWLLARCGSGDGSPGTKEERGKHCAHYADVLKRLREKGHVHYPPLTLTGGGRKRIGSLLTEYPDGLPDLSPSGTFMPFKIHVAPMGSGNKVIEDEKIWGFVSDHLRTTLALDMESFAIGAVAEDLAKKVDFLVMKGVMDFANHGRDDHFKEWAARASAECLIAFLRENLDPRAD